MIYHHSKGKNQFYSPKIQYFSNSLNQFIDYNWVPTDFMLNQWSNLILTLKIRQRLFILKRFSPPTVLLSPLSAIAAWNIQIFISLIARSSHVGTAKIWSSTFQSITIWSFVLNGVRRTFEWWYFLDEARKMQLYFFVSFWMIK